MWSSTLKYALLLVISGTDAVPTTGLKTLFTRGKFDKLFLFKDML
jgi:hypothetical protein